MALLSDLPVEIVLIIFSYLRVRSVPWENEVSKIANVKQFLLFSQTNSRLWSIARTFLYEHLEISVEVDNILSSEAPKFFHLHLQTALLCRTLQQTPSLASYTKVLSLRGMLYQYSIEYEPDGSTGSKQRFKKSCISYQASDLTRILTYFTNTICFRVFGALIGGICHDVNQIILSCMKSMTMLEALWLYAHEDTRAEVLMHFLNAASKQLAILIIASSPDRHQKNTITAFVDNCPIAIPRGNISYLRIPTDILPLVLYHPWLSQVEELDLEGITLSDGKTDQGLTVQSLLFPMTSTLVALGLRFNTWMDAPSLSDLDLSQLVSLEHFEYSGPWWIQEDDTPIQICQALFSKRYKLFSIDQKFGHDRHKIEIGSMRVLREALVLAHIQNCCPEEFHCYLDLEDEWPYSKNYAYGLEPEFDCLIQELKERGITTDGRVKH
jgi:hypothetical protein